METREFCRTMTADLSGWKEKMHGIISHVETLPALDRGYFSPDVNILRALISEIDDSMKQVRFDCPSDCP